MRSEELKWVLWAPRKAREAKRESDERKPLFWGVLNHFFKGVQKGYSHSIVPGGLCVKS